MYEHKRVHIFEEMKFIQLSLKADVFPVGMSMYSLICDLCSLVSITIFCINSVVFLGHLL